METLNFVHGPDSFIYRVTEWGWVGLSVTTSCRDEKLSTCDKGLGDPHGDE